MTTESPATGDRTSRPLIARWFARSKPRAPEHRPHQSAVPDATRLAILGVLELCADFRAPGRRGIAVHDRI